ncbi:sugar transferase [Georgenia sp. Z1344]|uniref:sugar transferase n=1 Tax=Georgenia sp. Z1344 TaxID=3416706 RepID=UPI003CF3B03D
MARWVKRVIDVGLSTLGIVAAAPIVAVAAVAIRMESDGPAIFKQERIGRDGAPFEILKLRTMTKDASKSGPGIAANDPRITRVGSALRATSIDELPQLVNVFKGDMSLVGPRPTLGYQVEQYTPRQRRRLEVRPGITGWAQVNGRNELSWAKRIELDIWYIDNWSNKLDMQIIGMTARRVLGREGTYSASGGTTLFSEGAL